MHNWNVNPASLVKQCTIMWTALQVLIPLSAHFDAVMLLVIYTAALPGSKVSSGAVKQGGISSWLRTPGGETRAIARIPSIDWHVQSDGPVLNILV